MTNSDAILKIEALLKRTYHFTDWDFSGGWNAPEERKCPRPDKREWLMGQFNELMLRLKDYLETNPNKEDLAEFINEEINQIDSENYLKEEYDLLIRKYGEIPLFGLSVRAAYDYLDTHQNLNKYYTQQKL